MDQTMLLLLLLMLSGKEGTMQGTLKRALDFYKDNKDAIQLLVKTMGAAKFETPPVSDPSDTPEPNAPEEKQESRPEADFHQTILEQFLKMQTP